MRQIPFEAEFAAVINMYTAFAYLESKAEDQKVLDAVNRALAPGGVFLIENVLRESIMRGFMPYGVSHLPATSWSPTSEFDLRSSRLNDRVTSSIRRRAPEYTLPCASTLTELEEMLKPRARPG
jgi:SAM-dependent methyltransferase